MNRLLFGDCRELLRGLAREGVRAQMCVTSPPYFNLRDYQHEGQLGQEATPDAYVAGMVEVFRCVRDVLADDGTLWVNIGDSYARTGGTDRKTPPTAKVGSTRATLDQMTDRTQRAPSGLKDKDLIGIPWMLAFALRADGWYLRQDIVWHKPNPMPESVTDRCTKAHEYIFLLSKGPRYYFDAEAMKEPAVGGPSGNTTRKQRPNADTLRRGAQAGSIPWSGSETRNKRSVWTVATRPYKGAHFATYPPALIEPCILAGSRVGDVVLDPFMGSGTTAATALKHSRRYIGCELNEDYRALQEERIRRQIAELLD